VQPEGGEAGQVDRGGEQLEVLLVAALTSAAQMTSESGSTATWAL
jgi:hypothetical protein